eukprot:15431586-Alexandrium_andersonii.AAC.1
MEARRGRPGRLHLGRGHAVVRSWPCAGSRPPATTAAIAAGHGGRPPGQRGGRAAPRRCRRRPGG